MIHIGTLKLKSNLILAPMAGITDLPFRMLNRGFGCELAFVEMINVRSLSHKSRRTLKMLSTTSKDKPLGLQLLGNEPKFILKALDVLKSYKFDILDFNAACPAKKVVRRGEGAGLLKEPKKISELLKILVKHSLVPVTVKIRSGWASDSVNAREVALLAQDAGVKGIFIHGRTKMQEYGGNVDYKIISQVKKAVDIPVIASGDIFSGCLAKKMFDETGCDAIAIARGALGNPWIFKEIKELLASAKVSGMPDKEEVTSTMFKHLDSNVAFYGEKAGVMKFRPFFIWYTKGFRNIRPLREKASRAKTEIEMQDLIKECSRNKKPRTSFGVFL